MVVVANAATQESRYPPDSVSDDACDALISQCDCFTISTPEGKIACGLAVDGSDPG